MVRWYMGNIPAVYAFVAKTTLRARVVPRVDVSTWKKPSGSWRSETDVTCVLVWRFTFGRSMKVFKRPVTNLYGQSWAPGTENEPLEWAKPVIYNRTWYEVSANMSTMCLCLLLSRFRGVEEDWRRLEGEMDVFAPLQDILSPTRQRARARPTPCPCTCVNQVHVVEPHPNP